jgi:hypothetical protein
MQGSLKDKRPGRFEFMYKKVEHLNSLNWNTLLHMRFVVVLTYILQE